MSETPQSTHACPQCGRHYTVSKLTNYIVTFYKDGRVKSKVSKRPLCHVCKGVELKPIAEVTNLTETLA